jgi:hypothetical protein
MEFFFARLQPEMQPSDFHPYWSIVRLRQACCMLVLFLAVHGGAAETNTAQFGPPGSWVKSHFFNQQPSTSLLDPSADEHLLLQERQVNVAQNETFFHSVQQILTSSGVQNGSTLTMEFNPGYQTLTLHLVKKQAPASGGDPLTGTGRIEAASSLLADFM